MPQYPPQGTKTAIDENQRIEIVIFLQPSVRTNLS